MSSFRLTPAASDDLRSITAYLAREAGESIAIRIEDELFDRFEFLARFPGAGHARSDLTRLPLVFFPAKPYLIVYNRTTSPIVIHAVLHSARDIKRTLRRRLTQ